MAVAAVRALGDIKCRFSNWFCSWDCGFGLTVTGLSLCFIAFKAKTYETVIKSGRNFRVLDPNTLTSSALNVDSHEGGAKRR
jgi:hypothetical protein